MKNLFVTKFRNGTKHFSFYKSSFVQLFAKMTHFLKSSKMNENLKNLENLTIEFIHHRSIKDLCKWFLFQLNVRYLLRWNISVEIHVTEHLVIVRSFYAYCEFRFESWLVEARESFSRVSRLELSRGQPTRIKE